MIAKHRIIVEGDEESNFSAYSPDLPGVVATGSTREECEREMHEAIEFHLEGLAEDADTKRPLLELEHVSKRYVTEADREIVVLDRVSLEIYPETFTGIYGARRSGKSTLLRVMAGIVEPTSGTVRFEGRDLARQSPAQRARMLRNGAAYLSLQDQFRGQTEKVIDHVAIFAAASDGITMRKARQLAEVVLEQLLILGHANELASTLSELDRVRVVLARALVRKPALLLLDEPATTVVKLDQSVALLQELAKEQHLTLVITSEQLPSLTGATTLLSLAGGQLRASSSRQAPSELRKRGIA